MKKITLCTTLAAAAAMTACTDYREQIAEAHDEYVSSKMSNYTDETESSGCLCALNSSGLTMNGGAYFYNYQSGGILNWNIYGCKSEYFPIVDLADWTWSNNSAGAWITEFGYDVKVELTVDPLAAVGVGLSVRVVDNNGNDIGEELSCPVVNVVGSQSIVSGTTTPQIDAFPSSSSIRSSSSVKSSSSAKNSSTENEFAAMGDDVECGGRDLWCKNQTGYQIVTGLDKGCDDSGYWYDYDGSSEGGTSVIDWPAPLGNGWTDYAFDNVIDYCKGLCGTFYLSQGTLSYNPLVFVSFNIGGSPNEECFSDSPTPVDASAWGGICITYVADVAPILEMGLGRDYETEKNFASPSFSLPKATTKAVEKCVAWSNFEQPSWYSGVNMISGDEASTKLASLRFVIQAKDGFFGKFNIIRIRKYIDQ